MSYEIRTYNHMPDAPFAHTSSFRLTLAEVHEALKQRGLSIAPDCSATHIKDATAAVSFPYGESNRPRSGIMLDGNADIWLLHDEDIPAGTRITEPAQRVKNAITTLKDDGRIALRHLELIAEDLAGKGAAEYLLRLGIAKLRTANWDDYRQAVKDLLPGAAYWAEQDNDPLDNLEVFNVPDDYQPESDSGETLAEGWYFWYCFPGCLPEGEASGPYESEVEATLEAISQAE